MEFNKKVVGWIISAIFSLILINLGIRIWDQEKVIATITILIGTISGFFFYYAIQIKTNEKKISNIEEWIESKEELLNTLKEIVILKKVSKIR